MLREDDDDADGRGDTCTDRDDNADTIWSGGVNDAEEDCVGEGARNGTGLMVPIRIIIIRSTPIAQSVFQLDSNESYIVWVGVWF